MPDAKISQLDPVAGADAADELPIARTNTTKKLTVQQVSDFAQTGVVLQGDAAGGALDGTYPNPGLAASVAGAGLAEAADVLSVNVDNTTIEITADTLNVKSGVFQPLDSDLTAIAALTPANDDIIQRKAGAWTNRTVAQYLADLAAAGTTFQPLDATLTALAASNWAANAIPIGTGADTLSQTAFAANTFPARSSAGNLVAKTITDFGLSLVDDADAATARTTLGLGTADTPQFTGIEVGNASDTTVTRASAGDIQVEGNRIFRVGGADVPLADGGTGASLADPNADRIMFWDDSAGAVDWLIAGTGLTITDKTITASGGGTQTMRSRVDIQTPQSSANQGNSFWTVLGLTDWDAAHWEFVKDVDGKAYGSVMVPSNYSSGGSLILAIAANATSGVTRWVVGTKAVADGESLNPTLTDETAQDITVPGTAYLRKDVTFTLSETLAAGDLLIVELYHNGAHANDTLAVNTLLFGAWLECTVTT